MTDIYKTPIVEVITFNTRDVVVNLASSRGDVVEIDYE